MAEKKQKKKRDQEKENEERLKFLEEKLDACVNEIERRDYQKINIIANLRALHVDDEKTRGLIIH
jgi:hypothetical protein